MKFHNVIAHPGGMHIMQSFISCIAKLMKSSGLEVHMWLQHMGPDRYAIVAAICYYIYVNKTFTVFLETHKISHSISMSHKMKVV